LRCLRQARPRKAAATKSLDEGSRQKWDGSWSPTASRLVLRPTPIQKRTKTIQEAPSQSRASERVSPTFFQGLLLAFPLTSALWVAVFLLVRGDI
jgi:hypothetical protein